MVDFNRNVYCVLGLPIDAVTMVEAVAKVREAAFSNTRCFVSTPNLNFAMEARRDAAFRESVLHSDLCLADGMPIVWVARLLGLPIRERVSGAGLFEHLLKHPGPPVTVYLFGGLDGAAEAACTRINQVGGGLRCVGYESPGFGDVVEMSTDEYVARINRSGAQFVVVALGAKKGQAWIDRNRSRLDAPVLCHLGAVMNFAAGIVKRAPPWVQSLGAEWLWRVKEEPALWRRYWRDGASFMGVLMRNVLPLVVARFKCVQARGRSSVTASVAGRRVTLTMQGPWCHRDLTQLRHLIFQAHGSQAELVFDMAGTTHVDSACVGLLLLAKGAFTPTCSSFRITKVTKRVAAMFSQQGASFMLEPASGSDRRDSGGPTDS